MHINHDLYANAFEVAIYFICKCFRSDYMIYMQMRVEKNNKAFAYRIYRHFTQQCSDVTNYVTRLKFTCRNPKGNSDRQDQCQLLLGKVCLESTPIKMVLSLWYVLVMSQIMSQDETLVKETLEYTATVRINFNYF